VQALNLPLNVKAILNQIDCFKNWGLSGQRLSEDQKITALIKFPEKYLKSLDKISTKNERVAKQQPVELIVLKKLLSKLVEMAELSHI
jgi:hypothetical protein